MVADAQALPVRGDASTTAPAHSLADHSPFGHVRLGPSSTWICGICDDAGQHVSVEQVIDGTTLTWVHVEGART